MLPRGAIVWDAFEEDLRGLGCTLPEARIKSFLEDLGLNHWVFKGQVLYKVPHGWNPVTKQEYPLDTEGVWETWCWTPSPEWERDNP